MEGTFSYQVSGPTTLIESFQKSCNSNKQTLLSSITSLYQPIKNYAADPIDADKETIASMIIKPGVRIFSYSKADVTGPFRQQLEAYKTMLNNAGYKPDPNAIFDEIAARTDELLSWVLNSASKEGLGNGDAQYNALIAAINKLPGKV